MSFVQNSNLSNQSPVSGLHLPKVAVNASSALKRSEQYQSRSCTQFGELLNCLELVHDEYQRAGYINESPYRMHASPFVLFPNFHTRYLLHKGKVIYTASFVLGSRFGLPSSDVFPDVITDLEAEGRTLAEGTLFAGNPGSELQSFTALRDFLLQSLTALQFHHIDDLLITVHPKHVSHWKKLFGFECIAGPTTCPHVQGSLGVLMRGNLETFRKQRAVNVSHLPLRMLKLKRQDIRTLLLRVPDLLGQLNFSQLHFIDEIYPDLDLLPQSYRQALIA